MGWNVAIISSSSQTHPRAWWVLRESFEPLRRLRSLPWGRETRRIAAAHVSIRRAEGGAKLKKAHWFAPFPATAGCSAAAPASRGLGRPARPLLPHAPCHCIPCSAPIPAADQFPPRRLRKPQQLHTTRNFSAPAATRHQQESFSSPPAPDQPDPTHAATPISPSVTPSMHSDPNTPLPTPPAAGKALRRAVAPRFSVPLFQKNHHPSALDLLPSQPFCPPNDRKPRLGSRVVVSSRFARPL